MKNFSVYFNYNGIFAFLIILLFIFSLWLSFKRIKGRYYPNYHIILIIRLITAILIIFVLLKPDIFFKYKKNQVPEVCIFIDKSMSIREHKSFNKDDFIRTLESIRELLSNKKARARYFTFADTVEVYDRNLKELNFDGNVTNLSSVLKYLDKSANDKNISAAVLISDGNYNAGEAPEFFNANLKFPLFTIGIGDTIKLADPYIDRIIAPGAIKLGDTLFMRIIYSDDGATGRKYLIISEDGKNLVDSLILRNKTGKLLGEINYRLFPSRTGIIKYHIALKVENDRNPGNNVKKIVVNVKRNNRRIFLINSYADFDSRFIKLILKKIDDTEVLNIVDNGKLIPDYAKEFFKQKPDLIILNGYPGRNSSIFVINFIKKSMRNVPIVLLINSNIDPETLNREFIKNIKLKTGKMNFVYPSLSSADHQIVRNLSVNYNVPKAIKRLPPIGYLFSYVSLPDDFIYFFETQGIKKMPIIAISRNNRLLLMIGEDFWRWYFMTLETETEGFFEDLLITTVKFMMDFNRNRQVYLNLDKNICYTGEKLNVAGVIYGLDGSPVNDGRFKVEVIDQKGEVDFIQELKLNNNMYRGTLSLLNPGEYKLIGEGYRNDVLLGRDTVLVEVMNIQIEKLKTGLNINVLKEIAKRNKGKFYFYKDNSWINGIELETKTVSKSKIVRFYNSLWIMIIIVGLLVVEWVVRKRTGYL